MPAKRARQQWKATAAEIGLAIVIVASVAVWFGVNGPQRAAHEITSLGNHTSTRVLFALIYAAALAVGLPAGSLSVIGGAEFGPVIGFVLDYTAIAVGAAAGYGLARAIGEPATRRFLHLRHGWLDRVQREHRFVTLVALQLSPLIPNGILNLAAGLTGVDFPLYMASVLVGNALPTLAYSYLGSAVLSAGAASHTPLAWVVRAVGIAVTLAILVPPLYAWVRRRRYTARHA
jgi:uncharacterized membrane protein YdjX (TVP38/TMEM64 family)